MDNISESLSDGTIVQEIHLRVLIYADDIVIFAEEPGVLQVMINRLSKHCDVAAEGRAETKSGYIKGNK